MRNSRILAVALVASAALAIPSPAGAAPSGKTTLAHVRYVQRGLTVQPPHQRAKRGKRKDPLYTQYLLRTRARERASVNYRDGTILYMNQRTDAVLRDPHTTVVKSGEIDEVHAPGTNHKIITAAAVASAVGTNFDVRQRGKQTIIIVVSGSVVVNNAKGKVTVGNDQETTVKPSQPPTAPVTVDAQKEIGWTVSLSSGGWEVLKTPPDLTPKGVAVDRQGNLYATDFSNDRVVKFSPAGKQIATWGSKGSGPGQLDAPFGIAVDSQGNVYVADGGNARIEKFSSTGQYLSQIGSPSGQPGSNPGEFFSPDGLAIDAHDNLYVADQGNFRIQKFSPSGQSLLVIGGLGQGPDLSEPEDVAVDTAGNIYVADTLNNRIVKLGPDGNELAAFGSKGSALGQLDLPIGVKVDGAGNIYVADTLNARVEEFAANGEPLTGWGAGGKGAGHFDQPNSLAIDRQGTLYTADTHRIQRLPGGAIPIP